MATPRAGKGQQETKVISQGTRRAEVVLITTYPDGKKTSVTKHYRVNRDGSYTDRASITGGRHTQKEDGKPKVWAPRGRKR
jgi:hypothetical protein